MLGEITHLQTISEDLKSLTMDPHKLPSSSEQVGTVRDKSESEFRDLVCVTLCVHPSCEPSSPSHLFCREDS